MALDEFSKHHLFPFAEGGERLKALLSMFVSWRQLQCCQVARRRLREKAAAENGGDRPKQFIEWGALVDQCGGSGS